MSQSQFVKSVDEVTTKIAQLLLDLRADKFEPHIIATAIVQSAAVAALGADRYLSISDVGTPIDWAQSFSELYYKLVDSDRLSRPDNGEFHA